jgi:hypothetical protein
VCYWSTAGICDDWSPKILPDEAVIDEVRERKETTNEDQQRAEYI